MESASKNTGSIELIVGMCLCSREYPAVTTSHFNCNVYLGSALNEPAVPAGPMFSGKSTELARRVMRFAAAGRKVLVISFKVTAS